ncbi:MAG: YfbK domain-containing protein, partial [Hyphomicrobiaceae bacterium]
AQRLPLLKNAFKMLLNTLRPDDTVGIVTYASGSNVALEPTRVAKKARILAAIDQLRAGGSTAGAQGIQDAYRLAEANFDRDAVNRVILGTDGDFNVGISDVGQLKTYIAGKRKSGVYLSILGVGQGNYNDVLMQALAQNGNGSAAYIDTLNEARKVLVEEASSTLFPIAKDVKIQLEFNPSVVRDYRLIGYETRALRRQDFNNDKIDAGDVGSGHAITAIYEFTPVTAEQRVVDDLRYTRPVITQPTTDGDRAARPDEIAFLKLRFKLPREAQSKLQSQAIKVTDALPSLDGGSNDVRFAVAVAAFGQLLTQNEWLGDYTYDDVIALAMPARGADPFGLRAEFINLVRLAKSANP